MKTLRGVHGERWTLACSRPRCKADESSHSDEVVQSEEVSRDCQVFCFLSPAPRWFILKCSSLIRLSHKPRISTTGLLLLRTHKKKWFKSESMHWMLNARSIDCLGIPEQTHPSISSKCVSVWFKFKVTWLWWSSSLNRMRLLWIKFLILIR